MNSDLFINLKIILSDDNRKKDFTELKTQYETYILFRINIDSIENNLRKYYRLGTRNGNTDETNVCRQKELHYQSVRKID